ncbi:MAG: short chain dehydrogenase [Hydrogenophilales bacterium CG_4_9_14_3_um_filter_59_35]|nr:MAG: short chain dehydrogenase [Hydrogenophilales bacterium CG_4_10_14_3_um_filter_58_23]PJB08595.1 MAG: short chain dehydrogenase [Hydrogenophilales bacterium CG_4_9_14_3_um_filter_59_35]
MRLDGCRALVTGATGGIGRATALALARKGARLALLGRNAEKLEEICREVHRQGGIALPVVFDLAQDEGHERAVAEAVAQLGGLDLLVNNAGALDFTPFEQQEPAAIERIFRTNTVAPLLLARAALPAMLAQGAGRIVNVGSIFGSIGFAYFAAYSASKFALRGFSEALRRELADTGVGVTYVAPRYTRTALNDGQVSQMAIAAKMRMDEPEAVAARILRAIEKERNECTIGGPEGLFARINALLPQLVDRALVSQTRLMGRFARKPAVM